MSDRAGNDTPLPTSEYVDEMLSDKNGKPAPPQREAGRLKMPPSLDKLREQVAKAVEEIDRLRDENEALKAQVQELETRPAVELDGTVLTFSEDPAVLRRKIEGFVNAIDQYLANT